MATLWRDSAKIDALVQLPWTVRTSRCEISGEFLGWVSELPGTCATAATPEELPAKVLASVRSHLVVAFYCGFELRLPAGVDIAAFGWTPAEIAELEAAIARPPRAN